MKDKMLEGWLELAYTKEKSVRAFYDIDSGVSFHVISDYEKAAELPMYHLRNRLSKSDKMWMKLANGRKAEVVKTLDLLRVLREAFNEIDREATVLYGAKRELEPMISWVKDSFPVERVGLRVVPPKEEPATTKGKSVAHNPHRTKAPKRDAILNALRDPELFKLSNVEIAHMLGVNNSTVCRYRHALMDGTLSLALRSEVEPDPTNMTGPELVEWLRNRGVVFTLNRMGHPTGSFQWTIHSFSAEEVKRLDAITVENADKIMDVLIAEAEAQKPEVIDPEVVDEGDVPDEASLNAMVNESLNEAIFGAPNEVAMEDNPVVKDLVPFSYEGQSMQVIRGGDGKPWFIGQEVCVPLGYADKDQAIRKHCKHAKILKAVETTLLKIPSRGLLIIPESDLYRLIMRSNMPDAERFQDWVVEDVLPKIRKHGGYIAGEEKMDDDQLIAAALLVAQRKIAEKNKLIAEQKTIIIEQAPKVEIADKFINNNQLWGADRVAKTLANEHGFNIGRNLLFEFMRDKGIFRENNDPYQEYVDRGYFRITLIPRRKGSIHDPVTGWTGKGFEYTLKLMGNGVYEAWLKARKEKAA